MANPITVINTRAWQALPFDGDPETEEKIFDWIREQGGVAPEEIDFSDLRANRMWILKDGDKLSFVNPLDFSNFWETPQQWEDSARAALAAIAAEVNTWPEEFQRKGNFIKYIIENRGGAA